MSLCVWGINIYRLTIIDSRFLFYTMVVGALISCSLIILFLKSSYSKFWIFVTSIAIGCGPSYFGLLYINQKFSDKNFTSGEFQIIKTGTLGSSRGRCHQPYAIIDFYGKQKEVIFYCEYESTIENYSRVKLSYSRGLFGFDVINSKELLR